MKEKFSSSVCKTSRTLVHDGGIRRPRMGIGEKKDSVQQYSPLRFDPLFVYFFPFFQNVGKTYVRKERNAQLARRPLMAWVYLSVMPAILARVHFQWNIYWTFSFFYEACCNLVHLDGKEWRERRAGSRVFIPCRPFSCLSPAFMWCPSLLTCSCPSLCSLYRSPV